ncbi:MAG: tetratricopeptide repeat protein [Isosphaeraceae bacterium]
MSALIDRATKQPSLHQDRGEALFKLGWHDDALADFREELAIQRARRGQDRYDEGLALYWIGVAELKRGRAEDADRAAREALSVFREVTGEESLDVARIRVNLGISAQKRGNFAKAVAQFVPALQALSKSKAFELTDEDRASITFALAFCYFHLGQPEQTESVLVDYERRLRSWPKNLQDIYWKQKWTQSMIQLDQFYRAWKKPEKAEPFDQQLRANGFVFTPATPTASSQPSPTAREGRQKSDRNADDGPKPGPGKGREATGAVEPDREEKLRKTRSLEERRRDAILMLQRVGASYKLNDDGELVSVSTSMAARDRMTDENLELLADMPALESLSLVGQPSNPAEHRITDGALAVLKRMPALRTLYLNESPFSDAALAHIGGLSQLKKLGLHGTKVTDAGLIHLKKLNKLEFLALSNTGTSDEGVVCLKDLIGLRQLLLSRTKVTELGVSRLKEMLPDCEVKW